MDYRRDIDGLRTLAVVPVMIYHLRIPVGDSYVLPGGFLGVDIFFVLSGFLITRIILDEMRRTGRFSLSRFYARRARRILPLLFTVILASVLVGIFILTPSEMSRLTASAFAALVFVSNAYWFVELEVYGEPVALLQPLLHTWSLAVEEQFYLLFPLIMLLIRPARWPLFAAAVLVVLLIASLITAEWTTAWLPTLSFYSPLSRAWEMLAGACLAFAMTFAPDRIKPSPLVRAVLPKLAVLVICVSMVAVDLDNVAHPGLVTLPIVLAALALIWAANNAEITTRVLSTTPFVYVGRLSYSLYLWHFPVYAFGRLFRVEQLTPLDVMIWLPVTALLSVTGYYLIERPFRYTISARGARYGLSAGLIAVTAVFFLGTRTDVLSDYRAAQLTALYGSEIFDNEALNVQASDWLVAMAALTNPDSLPNERRPSDDERLRLWFDDPDALNVLIIGNSHSRDMYNALVPLADENPRLDLARFGMMTVFPEVQRTVLLAAPNFQAADVVMIAPRYHDTILEEPLNALIDAIQEAGKVVVLVGNAPEFPNPARLPLYDYVVRGGTQIGGLDTLNAYAFANQNPRVAPLNARLQALAEARDVLYLSRDRLLCDAAEEICHLRLPDGGKALYDEHHWTLAGATFLSDRIRTLDWFAPVWTAACEADGAFSEAEC